MRVPRSSILPATSPSRVILRALATALAISVWSLNISSTSRSYVSDQAWKPVTALISCAVMRTVLPERRTLPSSTAPTFSLCATVAMSGCSPWNEKDEVGAATCSWLIRDSELSSSSVRPSEKYCCSLSPLMLMNGSTAMECGGGVKAAGDALAGAAGGVGGDAGCLEIQNLSATKYA